MLLNNDLFFKTMVAAVAVISGVSIRNGGFQISAGKATNIIGTIIFILGWIAVTYFISYRNGKISWTPIIAVLAIVVSVFSTQNANNKYGVKTLSKWSTIFMAIFAAGWIALGYSVARGKSNVALWLGMGAAGAVLLSMLTVLPWQRPRCMSDGPGMALFALGWVALAAANSM